MNNNNRTVKKSDKFELLDFSDEILLKIFDNFNDIDLLNASQVCRRFNSITKEIFAKKYNGDSKHKFYDIKVCSEDTEGDQKLYRTFLETFGNEIKAINFESHKAPNQHNLLKLIAVHCRSTKQVIINGNGYDLNLLQMIQPMSELTNLTLTNIRCTNFYWTGIHFPRLTTFAMDSICNIDVQALKQFLYINQQLENLRILDCQRFPLKVIQPLRDKMKRLKYFEYNARDNIFGNKCQNINMEQLESLKITVDASSFRTVLEAIERGSKQIRSLDISMNDDDDHLDGVRQQIDKVIPKFEKLTMLRLKSFDLTADVTRVLIQLLPHLVTLKLDGVRLDEFHPRHILFIFRKCKNMKELVLESDSNKMETKSLDTKFHRQFVDIVQSHGCDAKFELIQTETNMVITAQKITKNGEIIYPTSQEPLKSQSTVQFLDLSDEILERIYSCLDEESERALYETCTRTKNAMREQIMKQVFTVKDANSAKDIFSRFGEHIHKLAIDINTKNRAQTAAAWSFIGTTFSVKVTELSLVNINVSAVDELKIRFPNVNTLKIMSVLASRKHIFPPMECPELAQIEFHEGDITYTTKTSDFGVCLDNLTTIKLCHYSKNITNILHSLDTRVCDQIQMFSAENLSGNDGIPRSLIHIAMRFRNLTTLNLCISSVESGNTKYLFSSCTKLVKLTLGYSEFYEIDDWRRTLRNIKENCRHLEMIQLIRHYYGFDQSLLNEIADMLPKVKLYTISNDPSCNIFKTELFRRITKADRNKPY